jgi:hypothetical protein
MNMSNNSMSEVADVGSDALDSYRFLDAVTGQVTTDANDNIVGTNVRDTTPGFDRGGLLGQQLGGTPEAVAAGDLIDRAFASVFAGLAESDD